MKKTCQYSESQIEKSGLLTESRFREVQEAVTSRISPPRDRNGEVIGHALVVHMDDGTRWLHPCVDKDHAMEYVRRQALPDVLTESELESINGHCLESGRARREVSYFEKAQKVTEWNEGAWLGDDYHHTMDDLLDFLSEDEGEWPEYVWAARPQAVIGKLDVWDCCESMVCDTGWEDMDVHDLHGVTELQAALDKFTEANSSVVSYETDHRIAVLLSGYKAQKKESAE
jgi:hypothetical protein